MMVKALQVKIQLMTVVVPVKCLQQISLLYLVFSLSYNVFECYLCFSKIYNPVSNYPKVKKPDLSKYSSNFDFLQQDE